VLPEGVRPTGNTDPPLPPLECTTTPDTGGDCARASDIGRFGKSPSLLKSGLAAVGAGRRAVDAAPGAGVTYTEEPADVGERVRAGGGAVDVHWFGGSVVVVVVEAVFAFALKGV